MLPVAGLDERLNIFGRNLSRERQPAGVYDRMPEAHHRSFGRRSGLQPLLEFLHQHAVLDHVLRLANESLKVKEQRNQRKTQVDPGGNELRVNTAAQDHRCHRENHRPQGRRENSSFEHLRALNETFGNLVADHQILNLLARPDEVEHGHTLGQRNKKGREQTEEDMGLQVCGLPERESKIDGNAEANYGQ